MITDEEAREKLLQGVNKVATAVKGTIGPAAKTVIIQREGDKPPVVLNDGVSVAKAVHDNDPYVQMGIELIQQVAEQAQTISGDGTTTATVLAQAFCNLGFERISEGIRPDVVVNQIKSQSEAIIEKIKEQAISIEDESQLVDVATIAANNDPELGSLIAEVMGKVGKDGVVSVEVGSGFDTTYKMCNGFEIHSGQLSPHFPRNMDESNVLLVSDQIQSFDQLLPALELSIKQNRGLLIICNEINPRILPNLLINVMQGKVNAAMLKTPEMGKSQEDWLEDIQAMVGGPLYGKFWDRDITNVEEHGMGHILSMESKRDNTIVKVSQPVCDAHLDTLYQELQYVKKDDNKWEEEILLRRIGRLENGIASIEVGGYTEVELLETKERVDDAVNAVKAAMRNGVIAGGGLLLNYFGSQPDNDLIIQRAFMMPKFLILDNAGFEEVASFDTTYGIDAKTGKTVNFVEAGIIDPLDVTISSIRSAVSIASLVLGSNCLIPLRT